MLKSPLVAGKCPRSLAGIDVSSGALPASARRVDRHRNNRRDKHSRQVIMSRKAGILAAVYVAVLAINLDVTIVNVALPSIATELDADTRGL
jgi:hypothetical protein